MTNESQTDRRGFLKIAGVGVGGLIIGGLVGSLATPPNVVKSTVTQTVMASQTRQILTDPLLMANTGGAESLYQFIPELEARRLVQMGYKAQNQLMETAAGGPALMSGSARFLYSDFSTASALVRDQVGKLVAVMRLLAGSWPEFVMVGRKGLKPEDFAGNQNLKFGISRLGVSSHILPANMIRRKGFDPKTVNWIAVGGSGARLAALTTNQIDAGLLYTDLAANVIAQNSNLEVIGEFPSVNPWWFAMSDWAEKNPTVMEDFVKAQTWVADFIRDNPDSYLEQAIRWIEKDYNDQLKQKWAPAGQAFLSRILNPLSEAVKYQRLQDEIKQCVEEGVLKDSIPAEQVYINKYYIAAQSK